MCAGTDRFGNAPLFLASTLFHASTVLTTYFWLKYVLIFLGDGLRHRRVYEMLDMAVIAVQFSMLAVNFFVPTIFSVRDGLYVTELLRPLAFFNQYVVYLLIGILMGVRLHTSSGAEREKSLTVFCFSLAPILTGVFQLLYPDAPFYTISYFLGTIIIHLFIVQKERSKLRSLHHEMENQANRLKIAEQIALSNTDILTGLRNRRAYEDAVAACSMEEDFVYISIDINELKKINDTLGHAAGDELLVGAAECLRNTLGRCGEVYRIGGDEFAALVCPDRPINDITDEMTALADAWQGKTADFLALSYGVAEHKEFPNMTVVDLAKIADSRMYAHKTLYYVSKGIDRRGMQMAYSALCESYEKILWIDLKKDTFQIISINSEDIPNYASEKKLSEWLERFGKQGMVHPDDLEDYLAQTNRARLQAHFDSGNLYYSVFYRRLRDKAYHQTMMEILPAENYTPKNQKLYLYVKNIDRHR